MKIEQSAVTMNGSHAFSSECDIRIESECTFRTVFDGVAKGEKLSAGEASERDAQVLLMLQALIARMLEFITGNPNSQVMDLREVQKTDSGAVQVNATLPSSRGVEMEWKTRITESIRENESTNFTSSGKIQTEDGRSLDFTLELVMCREFQCERQVTKIEKAVLRDPLVINFTGQATELSGKHFTFDLDVDGKTESMPALGGGSGYLAIDSNADGRINDGSELFGTRSGNGFADLATFDADGNQWIDEADAAFDVLRIWQPDESGALALSTLREKGIGAIYLGSTETPFALTDSENRMLAQIRASGIYLREDGRGGTVQQVDLSV